MNKMD